MAATLRRILILLGCWAVSSCAFSQTEEAAEDGVVAGQQALVVPTENGLLVCTAEYAKDVLDLLNTTKDALKARALIEPCAEAGHDISQIVLALVYYQNREENPLFDHDESLRWSERAALQGHPDAQARHALSLSFYDTQTSEEYYESLRLMVEWYTKAAQQGHPLAQFELGEHYKRSTMDWTSAYMWLYLSLERFAEDSQWRGYAVSQLRDLESKIPQDELEAAEQRIRQWNIDHPTLNKIWPSDSWVVNMDNPDLRVGE